MKPLRVVPLSEGLDRIRRHRRGGRHLGEGPAVRPPELERAVGLSIHLVTLLVYRTMVPATEQREVRERGRATLRPVAHVMPLAQRESAAREAATAVPVVQRAPQRRWNGPCPRPDLHDAPVLIVSHHHPTRVACEAPRRFCGNVDPIFQHGLAWLIWVRQHRRVDVNHYLIPLARRAGIDPVVQRRLRD